MALPIKTKSPSSGIQNQTNGVGTTIQLAFSAAPDGVPAPDSDSKGYTIREEHYGTKRRLKVILMGAGASTINFLKKAEEEMQNLDIVVYEKNHDVGGTWLENHYPGCACDIPAVNYQFSWKITTWSHYYAYAPEIWKYLKAIEQENSFIEKYIKLKHRIEQAKWDEDSAVWRLKVRNLDTDEVFEDQAEFFINAGGVLNSWKWPDIPGLHDFKGKLMHSAAYEDGCELNGKKVAVLGAGSSGVQIVAALQNQVGHLYHWVRHPIWITAGFAQRWAGDDGANFACEYHQSQFQIKESDTNAE
jgi:cation diffusion facilitator CzcD-associated flavoprotein CzcO